MEAIAQVCREERQPVEIPAGFFVDWYSEHGRWFPWRDSDTTPFGIVIAEVLLRQTRAEMVAGVWPALMKRYPDAPTLTDADPQVLFSLVSPLGFGNQRSQALLGLARQLTLLKKLPSEIEQLIELPHIGLYSAHAVACFAFGQRVPVVDLNVIRVVSRVAGIDPPRDIRRAPRIWDLAWSMLPEKHVVEHNFGLLDFSATVCKPRGPRCADCQIASQCAFLVPGGGYQRIPVGVHGRVASRLGEQDE